MLSVFIAYVFTKSCSSRKDLDSRKQWCDNECKQSTGNDSTRVGNDRLCPAFTLSDCIDAHPLSLQGLLTHIHFPYKVIDAHLLWHKRIMTHAMDGWRTSTLPTWSIDALPLSLHGPLTHLQMKLGLIKRAFHCLESHIARKSNQEPWRSWSSWRPWSTQKTWSTGRRRLEALEARPL